MSRVLGPLTDPPEATCSAVIESAPDPFNRRRRLRIVYGGFPIDTSVDERELVAADDVQDAIWGAVIQRWLELYGTFWS